MDAQSIRAALAGCPPIRQVIHCDSLGSTNDLARQFANEGAPEIVLISADEQTSGRGRMDRGHERHGASPKDVLVYPLCRKAREKLREV